MSRVTVTSTGINDLRAVLESAAEEAVDEARKVVARGAVNIKRDARRFASGIAHAPAYPYTIGYDMRTAGTLVSAEIGPDKGKQVGGGPHRTPGNLGHILEYGTVRSAPHAHLGPALDIEGPKFVAAVERLGTDVLEGR